MFKAVNLRAEKKPLQLKLVVIIDYESAFDAITFIQIS